MVYKRSHFHNSSHNIGKYQPILPTIPFVNLEIDTQKNHLEFKVIFLCVFKRSYLLHLIYDSFERCGVVHSEVSKNLTVNLDTCFVKCTHQLRV